ncbi:MAG: sulfite exporter TauE/SafE family protein [Clostridiales bacterium]|jgi:uncharacterized membrane protein YfcA|nr:sulfite exporter TauE/SafE family protein [Clostridiales bacterium]
MNKFLEKTLSAAGGLFIGFVNGFFGSGGGMLCVPLLEKVLKEPTKTAHATAILVILPISIASAVMYILNGSFDLFPALTVSGGVLAGGVAGAFLLKILPAKIVGLIFALSMIGVGVKLIFF